MIKGVPALTPTSLFGGPKGVQKTIKFDAKKGVEKWKHRARKVGA